MHFLHLAQAELLRSSMEQDELLGLMLSSHLCRALEVDAVKDLEA